MRVDGDHADFQYLKSAKDNFVEWKASGTTGLTNKIFTAFIQTMNVLSELVKHLQEKHGFS